MARVTLCSNFYLIFDRACRLKKKAQHEANKVKLYGLDIEHKQLLYVIDTIKEDLHNFIIKKGPQLKFSTRLQDLVKENLCEYNFCLFDRSCRNYTQPKVNLEILSLLDMCQFYKTNLK